MERTWAVGDVQWLDLSPFALRAVLRVRLHPRGWSLVAAGVVGEDTGDGMHRVVQEHAEVLVGEVLQLVERALADDARVRKAVTASLPASYVQHEPLTLTPDLRWRRRQSTANGALQVSAAAVAVCVLGVVFASVD